MGGGTILPIASADFRKGLSPRGRGNPGPALRGLLQERSIPAWAGEPAEVDRILSDLRVYPRVGGGTTLLRDLPINLTGLSPRGRGNLSDVAYLVEDVGSIPAWAGEPP